MAASVNKDDMYVPLEGARVYLALRQPQMALAYLNSDHKKCSGMGEYWALMSLSHYSLGQFQNTVNEANKAKDLGYQNADLLAAAADSSARLGHNDEAVSFATSAVGLNPNNAMALYVRGQCWKKLKRDDLAKEDLQKAASLGYAPK